MTEYSEYSLIKNILHLRQILGLFFLGLLAGIIYGAKTTAVFFLGVLGHDRGASRSSLAVGTAAGDLIACAMSRCLWRRRRRRRPAYVNDQVQAETSSDLLVRLVCEPSCDSGSRAA